jgi:hypothetical protein
MQGPGGASVNTLREGSGNPFTSDALHSPA